MTFLLENEQNLFGNGTIGLVQWSRLNCSRNPMEQNVLWEKLKQMTWSHKNCSYCRKEEKLLNEKVKIKIIVLCKFKVRHLHCAPSSGHTGTAVTLQHWSLSTITTIMVVNSIYYNVCMLLNRTVRLSPHFIDCNCCWKLFTSSSFNSPRHICQKIKFPNNKLLLDKISRLST